MRGIYTVTCTATGRVYVGSTGKFGSRMVGHLDRLQRGTHGNKQLQRDFDEHGISSIAFRYCYAVNPNESVIDAEEEAILQLHGDVELYNRIAHPDNATYRHRLFKSDS